MKSNNTLIIDYLKTKKDDIFENWVKYILQNKVVNMELLTIESLKKESIDFVNLFITAISSGNLHNINTSDYKKVSEYLVSISKKRAKSGFSPSETSSYILSFKEVLFQLFEDFITKENVSGIKEILLFSNLIDKLSLITFEAYVKTREEIIIRQREEILEVSTPVIHLWEGILALPIIGTLDSARSQKLTECLLKEIAKTGYEVAVLDISGVPTVDSAVAQHLLRTIYAARLMGADCIISGIRPEIAQTIVNLGVELPDVKTKSTLSSALKEAFDLLDIKISGGNNG